MSVCFILPYTPLLYSKTKFYRGIYYFLIFALKHILWVPVRTASTHILFKLPEDVWHVNRNCQQVKGTPVSKALTCMIIYLYKQIGYFIKETDTSGYIIARTMYTSHKQINLRRNKQLLSTQQHAYQSCFSYFLFGFRLRHCGILDEF